MSSGLGPEKFTDSAAYWLGLYFFFNLGLTLFNKFVLVSFPFPYTLTGLHALSGCVGCYVALERGSFTPARLTHRENLILCAFSVLYTINIAVSNISLQLVTVPFHQVVRASTPFFTILTSALLLGTRFTMAKMVALLPVVAGVGFATYGDYYFTAWGLVLTLLGTFLAALKTVATNLIQTGGGGRLKLHPLDLLMRMSPLAFVQCVVYGWYTGELERVRQYGATQMTRGKAIALLINGVIACGLNIVSFTANKKSGPLTMTVSANCKQVMTIALAVVLFDLNISITNAIGILLTLVGGVWYGMVEYRDKQRRLSKMGRA
ncbi:TPT-domain-containing protein [Dioszegia hungarica]|uniref:TPT-domain-containing protein n=1 Tax=Dioszegia hungarica TaxID=4972 RepID=A0AA38HEV5_9TREE|nr:TPT-domain-containing protein [Dioszegia hungarica]KAI9638239.1 TPT-domain-containing protein [Dioszegia hungarica]